MELLFENIVGKAFADKVRDISTRLGINPNWLMLVFFNESSLQSTAQNNIGCVGLLQWCADKGTPGFKMIGGKSVSLQELKSKPALEQLDYVYDYFKPYRSSLTSYENLSLATLTPGYLDEADNDAFVFPNWVVNGNKALFTRGTTMKDYRQGLADKIIEVVPVSLQDEFFKKKAFSEYTSERLSLAA